MNLRIQTALLTLPFALALGVSACSDDTPSASGDESGSESGESGESTGDETSTSDTTTTDPATTSGDGDGDACPIGSEGCPCTVGGACDPGLMCDGGICVPAAGDGDGDPTTSGDGDGDPTTTGDGDGDPTTTGDGDGDPTTTGDVCDPTYIEILAVDATEFVGWSPFMSQLGEGMILAWDNDPNGYVSWDIDIPCADDWHVWVRGVDNGNDDSFYVLVDGGPMPIPIFELDCTADPQNNGLYRWNELNWRDQDAGACDYVEDPWVQAWDAGTHNVTLGYRESIALSRIWITNTNDMPPMP